jgi:hypothetical protein
MSELMEKAREVASLRVIQYPAVLWDMPEESFTVI